MLCHRLIQTVDWPTQHDYAYMLIWAACGYSAVTTGISFYWVRWTKRTWYMTLEDINRLIPGTLRRTSISWIISVAKHDRYNHKNAQPLLAGCESRNQPMVVSKILLKRIQSNRRRNMAAWDFECELHGNSFNLLKISSDGECCFSMITVLGRLHAAPTPGMFRTAAANADCASRRQDIKLNDWIISLTAWRQGL